MSKVSVTFQSSSTTKQAQISERVARTVYASAKDPRIEALIELIGEYDLEKSPEEKENIHRTLIEILENKPLELKEDS